MIEYSRYSIDHLESMKSFSAVTHILQVLGVPCRTIQHLAKTEPREKEVQVVNGKLPEQAVTKGNSNPQKYKLVRGYRVSQSPSSTASSVLHQTIPISHQPSPSSSLSTPVQPGRDPVIP